MPTRVHTAGRLLIALLAASPLLGPIGIPAIMPPGTGVVAPASAHRANTPPDDPRILDLRDDQVAVPGVTTRRETPPPGAAQRAARVHHVWISVVSATDTTADDSVAGLDPATVRQLVARVNDFWSAESGGDVRFELGGIESVKLSQPSCDPDEAWNRISQSAFRSRFASGQWVGTNDHLVILPRESCNTLGFGTVGGNGGIILSTAGAGPSLGVPVALHEFGHNLGFSHANAAICLKPKPFDAIVSDYARPSDDPGALCPIQEYADFLDIMGYSIPDVTPRLSSPQRIAAGYTTAYTTVTRSAIHSEFRLLPVVASSASGIRALRIVDPATGEIYYVELRTPTGVDANSAEFTWGDSCIEVATAYRRCELDSDPATGAVRVLRAFPLGGESTLATTVLAAGPVPGMDDGARHTHLLAGDTFTNHTGRFTLTVSSIDLSGASVSVDFAPPAATSTALELSAPAQVYGGTTPAIAQASVAPVDGTPPAGAFAFRDGATILATVRATDGIAQVRMPRTLAAGSHSITARFLPSGDVAASTSPKATLSVAKATSTTGTRGPTTVRKGQRLRLTVTVAVPELSSPTGTVAAYSQGKKLGYASLSASKHGVLRLTLRPFRYPGQKTLTVRYGGTPNIVGSVSAVRAVIVRR